jgi:hypothetical protein
MTTIFRYARKKNTHDFITKLQQNVTYIGPVHEYILIYRYCCKIIDNLVLVSRNHKKQEGSQRTPHILTIGVASSVAKLEPCNFVVAGAATLCDPHVRINRFVRLF